MYRFIQNIGDYFNPGYFTEDFKDNVFKESGFDSDDLKELNKRFSDLRHQYYDVFKKEVIDGNLPMKYVLKKMHDFHSRLLQMLGYNAEDSYSQWLYLDTDRVVPVRHIYRNGTQPQLMVMEMQPMLQMGDQRVEGLFEQCYEDESEAAQRYRFCNWQKVTTLPIPEGCKISPKIINEAIEETFYLPEDQRPKYVLVLAGSRIYLLEEKKFKHGSYLVLDIEELISEAAVSATKDYYTLFYLLCGREALANESQTALMDKLGEASTRNAYAVTKDLKEGVITAVESLANEAIYYIHNVLRNQQDETNEQFAKNVKDDCITIVYRLLFIFYAEARPELGILPMNDEVYLNGYSLDKMRDLETVQMQNQSTKDGYFIHDSLWRLFQMIHAGYNEEGLQKTFVVKRIDSPLFDDSKLKALQGIKYRNSVWQKIIYALSISKPDGKRQPGRISYINLGINQLGSVYESLLAYRGFYAEQDYIEVFKAGAEKDGTFLVPASRMDDFEHDEIKWDANGDLHTYKKGTFIYRLNGRDRQKSASYYTPEVLTQSTVKYTLKGFIERLKDPNDSFCATDLLNLKILEPAMGAAAFQNEVINQLAELYIMRREEELGKHVPPMERRNEVQKVKAYIATHNVYGVDLNPTAIELGKLSLWLNVIHNNMETPFFANRLCLGNAVIGAWLKVYSEDEIRGNKGRGKLEEKAWWTKAPHKLKHSSNRLKRSQNEIYHFLLPDKAMLAVRNISEQKKEHPAETKRMNTLIKDWTAPITDADFKLLQKLSDKIDFLLSKFYDFQNQLEHQTQNKVALWGIKGHPVLNLNSYEEKEFMNNKRNDHNHEYFRLKMVMDYWCALWFWEYDRTVDLPTRYDYWNDIDAMLNVTDEELATQKTRVKGAGRSFFDDSTRFEIVAQLSERYHFFHPMLEFLEVFWLRDGFDIICGNPPWLKLEFNDIDIVAEKFPEVVLRNISAPDIRNNLNNYFAKDEENNITNKNLKGLYVKSQIEYIGSTSFINASCNYSLLSKQQADLYKCILVNGFVLLNNNGFMGLLHPESVYDDSKGQPLRKEIYKRLRYHFQYRNEYTLFAEVSHTREYSTNVYGSPSTISFKSINNLFHPDTVDKCFEHQGEGLCGGIKINGKWNVAAHRNRIVHFTKNELMIMSDTFEDGAEWDSVKLTSIQANVIISVLEKLSKFNSRVADKNPIITVDLDETGAVKSGIIKRRTYYPSINDYQVVFNGPQFYVSNPIYKNPREVCRQTSDYDSIDLSNIDDSFVSRSNYQPIMPLGDYKSLIKGFVSGLDANNTPIYDDWIDYYKLGFRNMLDCNTERTLICAVLPRKTAHIHGVRSVAFRNGSDTVDMAALCSSIVMDFYTKTIGASNLMPSRMQSFPLGVESKYKSALYPRTLMLNCLTKYYADLWCEVWSDDYRNQAWSIDDARLHPFGTLKRDWSWGTPLRNYFERRQALVEIDVIAAMALGLSLQDLEMIYTIQFPVLQQNENDTWYDRKGNIVFTCSKGLTGVGVDRPVWETIRNMKEGETYEHTIEKSELYKGQKMTYYAPFTKCDRIEDYRRAWAHFEKMFNATDIP